jgi:hypothetical protein
MNSNDRSTVISPMLAQMFAVDVGEKTVILDLCSDRYLLAVGRPNNSEPQADFTPNLVYGFGLDVPAASKTVWPDGRWRVFPSVHCTRYLREVNHLLGQVSFAAMIERLAGAAVSRTGRAPRLEDLLSSYEIARPFYGEDWVCRLDAPALCLLARRYGYEARLVIGVRLDPFGAHCWAQVGETILNEPVETVAQYSPILAV